jgi:hypothetical protein
MHRNLPDSNPGKRLCQEKNLFFGKIYFLKKIGIKSLHQRQNLLFFLARKVRQLIYAFGNVTEFDVRINVHRQTEHKNLSGITQKFIWHQICRLTSLHKKIGKISV